MKVNRFRSFGFAATIVLLAANFQLRAQQISPDFTPSAVLNAMQRVADWQLAHPSKELQMVGCRLPVTQA